MFPGADPNKGMSDYIDGICRLARWLCATYDCEILLISTCQGIPEYLDDSAVAIEIAKRLTGTLPGGKVRVDREFHDPRDLQKILAETDLVVATRMHMAILALCAGIPVFPIAYEFKTAELFARLGMGKFVMPIESIRGDNTLELARDFLAELPSIRRPLFESVERERKLALTAEPLLKAVGRQAA
jgi:colanic acid/amylovoran biosynthesis protein